MHFCKMSRTYVRARKEMQTLIRNFFIDKIEYEKKFS